MNQSHAELQAMLPDYALGTIDAADRQAMEAHLKECAECDAEFQSLQGVVDALARSVPQRTPPPDLRRRVLAAAAGFSAAPVLRADESPGPWRDRRVWLPATAMLLVALGAGIYGSHLHVETRLAALSERADANDREIALARRAAIDARSAMEIIAARDVVQIDLEAQAPEGGSARAWWSRQHGMVFAGGSLAPPPPNRCYQVWIVTDGGALSAGILSNPTAALAVFDTPADLLRPSAVALTVEPLGGASAPTGARLLLGRVPRS